MSSRQSVWRRRAGLLALATLLAAGNLAFFLWYRSTTQDRERSLEARRAQLDKEVESVQAEAARLSGQRERLSQVSSAITEFYARRVGSRRESLAPVVEEIHTVLRRVGVNPAQISYSIQTVSDLPLTEMRITFSFRNDYAKFKQLLAAFESDRRWIVIRDVNLSRDSDFPGGVQVHIQLSTYFAGETDVRPRAATAATASTAGKGSRR
jgi:Tfp pilus assembly protein PilO